MTGPATAEYAVPPLPAGEYYFQCDVHPTMNGTVVDGPAGGGTRAGRHRALGLSPQARRPAGSTASTATAAKSTAR